MCVRSCKSHGIPPKIIIIQFKLNYFFLFAMFQSSLKENTYIRLYGIAVKTLLSNLSLYRLN